MARKTPNKKRRAITGGGTSSEIPPAAELIAGNVDLLEEILLRFPAKTLIRFKSVSKHWLSLISHPQFSINHSSRNPSPSISAFYFYRYRYRSLESVSLHGHKNLPSLSFLDGLEGKDYKPRILDSCNGLLLCETGSTYDPIFVVCNVTTQKYKLVPKPSGLFNRKALHRSAHVAFDPSKSPHYKVVLGSHHNRSKSEPWLFEIDMFDSEGGNWKRIVPSDSCWGRGVFWNGAIHWLSKSQANVLLRFDVDAEEVVTLQLPPRPRILGKRNIKYFGECGGCLILVQVSSDSPIGFAILELESDTSRPMVKYWVNLSTIELAFPKMEIFEFYVMSVVKGKEKEDYTLVLAVPGKVISFNLKSNTVNVLRDLQGGLIDEGVNGCAYPFVETLSPI